MGQAHYADVNGVHMYYEESGTGDPVILLHGGFGGTHLFGAQVPAFAERYRVLVPEQRGRGHTPDVEGPISYRILADDMVAFLERTVGQPTDLVGFSDGGIVGLLVAISRPDLLRRLVTVGANFHRDGLLDRSRWVESSSEDQAWAAPRQSYGQVSPDGPDHFRFVFAKLQRMWREEPTLTAADLGGIPLPVLVVAGDDDVVDHRHTLELFRAVPRAQLAIIPGASHAVFLERPALLNTIILDFLAGEEDPATILPVRRAHAAEG